jgi:hypothetical protein
MLPIYLAIAFYLLGFLQFLVTADDLIHRGLIFSFLFYFIPGDIRVAQILCGYRYLGEVLLDMAKGFAFARIFATITYGIIFGYLYKKKFSFCVPKLARAQ